MLAIILHPTITLQLGPLTIFTWGLFVSLGIVAALILAWLLTKKPAESSAKQSSGPASIAAKRLLGGEKLNFDHILNISLISIILGFIGSRLLFIFLEPNLFQNPIEIIRIWDGGLALYGGLILAIFGSVIYAKKNKLDVLTYADMFVLPIILSIAIARIGCLLVNDHLGKLTNLPWGIMVDGITRHPISAYYSISLFILFAILLIFRQTFLRLKGATTFFAITFYSMGRFTIDNFKDFEGKAINFYLNQIFLLLVFIVSLYFLLRIINSSRKKSKK